MLSISSVFSAISSSVRALGKAPQASASGNSITQYAAAVDDVVSLSSQGIKAAGRAQTDIASRAAERKADSLTAKVLAVSIKPDTSQQIIDKLQRADHALRTPALVPTAPSSQDSANAIKVDAQLQIATQQVTSSLSTTNAKAFSQQSILHAEAFPSPEVKRGITAYQENRDMFSLVAQISSFRTSA